MVQQIVVGELKFAADTAKAQISRTENKAADASVDESPRTHDARLERGIECRAFKTVVGDVPPRLAQRDDFGMCRGVVG